MVPSQHANTQGKTYQEKGKVLLKGWPVVQGSQADCANGRRWEGLIKQGPYQEDNFLDTADGTTGSEGFSRLAQKEPLNGFRKL